MLKIFSPWIVVILVVAVTISVMTTMGNSLKFSMLPVADDSSKGRGTSSNPLAEEEDLCTEGLSHDDCTYRDFGVGQKGIIKKDMVDMFLKGDWVEIKKPPSAVQVLQVCCHKKIFTITLGKKKHTVEYRGRFYEVSTIKKKSENGKQPNQRNREKALQK